MSTNRQKSFITTLTTNAGNLHIPQYTYGRKIVIGVRPWLAITEDKIDVSNYLCADPNSNVNSLQFYFRCSEDYYTIYLRSPGPFYGRTIGRNGGDELGAYIDDNPTTFNLIDNNGKIVTLDQITTDTPTLIIQTRGGTALVRNKATDMGYFIRAASGAVLKFRLKILERNAPFLNNPDEV